MSAKLPDEIKSYTAGERSSRSFAEAGSTGYRYKVGHVSTPHGVVGVYAEANHTSAVIVLAGREYRGWWRRDFTERALVAACRRFAAHVSGDTK